jgi:hypothetical protein
MLLIIDSLIPFERDFPQSVKTEPNLASQKPTEIPKTRNPEKSKNWGAANSKQF